MTRPAHIWLIFSICFCVLLAGMAWVSWTALQLDAAQSETRRQAEFEEKIRLALWRMDSTLSPLIVQESSRPYFTYSAFFPAGRAYNKMFGELQPDDVLLPSPLLAPVSTNVLLHFQYQPDGRLTSPQVPTGNKRDLAENRYLNSNQIVLSTARLAELQVLLEPNALLVACVTTLPSVLIGSSEPYLNNQSAGSQNVRVPYLANQQQLANAPSEQQQIRQQKELNQSEQQARAITFQQAANSSGAYKGAAERDSVSEGMVKPIWFGEALVLARRVRVGKGDYIQGCWLDWPNIQHWMTSTVQDLLPQATLTPMKGASSGLEGRLLASLPVQLLPGPLPAPSATVSSPIRYALVVAWLCVLLAGLAVAVLLHGTVSLSERRGAFVSAVTHELRTPLTTFKMYSEMLAEGMVSDETKRQSYLQTLCAEANRLSHLVENVLAYARLERGNARSRIESVSLEHLLQRVKPRLLQRAEQAGMALSEDSDPDVLDKRVHVDVPAVEQILFNLVDNACKYAAPTASEKVIHLEALQDGKFTMLRVRDHGQGVSPEGARRLFRPFSKSAHEAAHSAPGIGLGLALCRRLSRSMGGDLRLDPLVLTGACFVLRLPTSQGPTVSNGAASYG